MTNWITNKKRKCRKIGTKFATSVGTFEVVEATDKCEGCFMHRDTPDKLNQCKHNAFSRQLAGACKAQARKDGKYVIFKKVDNTMKIKEIVKKANNGEPVPYHFVSLFIDADYNIGKNIEHIFKNTEWSIEVSTNFGRYAVTEFGYTSIDKITSYTYEEIFSSEYYFKDWSDYQNGIKTKFNLETDDIPENAVLLVSAKRTNNDGFIKVGETVFSILKEKILNPSDYRDIIVDIYCKGKECEVIAHCKLTGILYNDDSSPDKIEVIVECVEENF